MFPPPISEAIRLITETYNVKLQFKNIVSVGKQNSQQRGIFSVYQAENTNNKKKSVITFSQSEFKRFTKCRDNILLREQNLQNYFFEKKKEIFIVFKFLLYLINLLYFILSNLNYAYPLNIIKFNCKIIDKTINFGKRNVYSSLESETLERFKLYKLSCIYNSNKFYFKCNSLIFIFYFFIFILSLLLYIYIFFSMALNNTRCLNFIDQV